MEWSLVVSHHLLGSIFRVFNSNVQLFYSIPCCSVCRIDRIVSCDQLIYSVRVPVPYRSSFLFWNACFFSLSRAYVYKQQIIHFLQPSNTCLLPICIYMHFFFFKRTKCSIPYCSRFNFIHLLY